MFSEKDLQVLLDFSAEGQVLSVYLNTDPTTLNTEAAKLRLRNMLKTIDLPEDIQAVEDYVNFEYDWAARGVVIFSNQKRNFFQEYQFELPVPDQVFAGERPLLRPLVNIMDTFMGWSVVLIDKQSAHLFSFDLGEMDALKTVDGDEVKQQKRGGGHAIPGLKGGSTLSANIENIIDRNFKEVIEMAESFFMHHHTRRIMIGGTDDNIARFMTELPKSWQSLIVGEFPMSMTASRDEVLDKATEEALKTQKEMTGKLVERAITLAAKGSTGVIGLIDTLNAIHEGRVKTLLVSEEFEQEGYRCKGCGYLTTQVLQKCPFCSGEFEKIDTAVEMAVQESLRKSAEVKVVQDNQQLKEAGQIAALLRY